MSLRGALRLSVAGLAFACTPASAPTVPTVLPVGAGVTAIPPLATTDVETECFVNDVQVGLDVEVSPKGEPPFKVRVRKMPLRVRIEPKESATVFVSGPVELTAHLALDEGEHYGALAVVTGKNAETATGLLRVAPGHHLKSVRPHGPTVTSTVLFGDLGVENVDLRCGDLALASTPIEGIELASEEEHALFLARGPIVQICTDTTLTTCVGVPKGLPLIPKAEQGRFLELDTSFKDGSRIRGWARRSDLEAVTEAPLMGFGATGGCGCGSSLSHRGRYPPDPREHYGDAVIAVGAKVFATSEGKGPWATTRGKLTVRIAMGRDDAFAKLEELPGISTSLGCDCDGMDDHAYVAREAVTPIR